MEYLFIYLLQIFDLIECIEVLLFLILIILFIGLIVIFCSNTSMFNPDKSEYYADELCNFNKIKKYTIWCTSILVFLSLIPAKHTLLLMGGTYYGKKAVNTVVTSDKIEKVNKIIDLQLDKYIQDLKIEVNQNE